jgi:hypothetical protein
MKNQLLIGLLATSAVMTWMPAANALAGGDCYCNCIIHGIGGDTTLPNQQPSFGVRISLAQCQAFTGKDCPPPPSTTAGNYSDCQDMPLPETTSTPAP